MNKLWFPFVILFFIVSCNNESVHPVDQTYTVRGTIMEKGTSVPVAHAVIGFRNPSVPDSILFQGDSVVLSLPAGVYGFTMTDSLGYFQIDMFLGHRDTSNYKNLFVYKTGYFLWRYDLKAFPVKQEGTFVDRIDIQLDKK